MNGRKMFARFLDIRVVPCRRLCQERAWIECSGLIVPEVRGRPVSEGRRQCLDFSSLAIHFCRRSMRVCSSMGAIKKQCGR
jgi:hypothetical protein